MNQSSIAPILQMQGVAKRFTLHHQNGIELPVLAQVDLAVARLLAHRMVVMQRGRVVESGLTDQVLDDPQHPYTQLLVSSVLQP